MQKEPVENTTVHVSSEGIDADEPMLTSENDQTIAKRKSYQLRALFRKTLAYQKRQWFTNICCVSLCPILMIIISAGLAAVIDGLINKSTSLQETLYCSNLNASDFLNFPIFNSTDPSLPVTGPDNIQGATLEKIVHANFLYPKISLGNTNGPPGALIASSIKPCVFWFGAAYPYNDEVYSSNPDISPADPINGLDTTYFSQPKGGFFSENALKNEAEAFVKYQTYPWYLTGKSASVSSALLGTNAKPDPISPFSLLNGFTPGQAKFTPANQSSGMLDSMETRYYFVSNGSDFSTAPDLASVLVQPVPWFEITESASLDSLDDELGKKLNDVISGLASVDKTVLLRRNPSTEKYVEFIANISLVTRNMPYGAVYFDKVDTSTKELKMTLATGGDIRLDKASNFPFKGFRQALQLSQLTNAFLRYTSPSLASASITQGVRAMPLLQSSKIVFPFGSLIGGILFPFGVSFLLPIFVITLVKEKEDRILIMMKMNGLKTWTYYLTHYLHCYSLHILSSLFFLVAGYRAKLDMFDKTAPGVLILCFFIWGHAQVALALFFSTFFKKSRDALVIVFLIVLCGVIISLAFESLFEGSNFPTALFIWPPFAFYRILATLNRAAYTSGEVPYTISKVVPGDEVFTALWFLTIEVFVFFTLAYYLSTVIPSEFGVARPWYWPATTASKFVQEMIRKYKGEDKTGAKKFAADAPSSPKSSSRVAPDENELILEDDDVRAERKRVLEGRYDPTCPLIMKHMRKEYASRGGLGPKLAVKDVTFAVEKGVVFGLLGPNGAGKTTLISILTGLYPASSGIAKISGLDIHAERDQVYKTLGICPQYDILWDDLTVEEHILFYARLKGVPADQEQSVAKDAMKFVSLEAFRDRLTKGLSGGEKRRLSISLALVGNPTVVFLDEPTTGLDPNVRRLIWNIIIKAREKRTIVLTTHSMEEAEVLCQRIGIMAKGTLRCIGPQLRLKQLYGSGFRIQFICHNPYNTLKACEYIESLLPAGKFRKLDSFATSVSYEFVEQPNLISKLFEEIEKDKTKYGIVDWGLSQTTLEEVFIKLLSEADANAD